MMTTTRVRILLLSVLCVLFSTLAGFSAPKSSVEEVVASFVSLSSETDFQTIAPFLTEKNRVELQNWSALHRERFASLLGLELGQSATRIFKIEKSDSSQCEVLLGDAIFSRRYLFRFEQKTWCLDLSLRLEPLQQAIDLILAEDRFNQAVLEADEMKELYPLLTSRSIQACEALEQSRLATFLEAYKMMVRGTKNNVFIDYSLESNSRAMLLFESPERKGDFHISFKRETHFGWENSLWKVNLEQIL